MELSEPNVDESSEKDAVNGLLDRLSGPAQTIGRSYTWQEICDVITAVDLLAYRELRQERKHNSKATAHFYEDGRFEIGKMQFTADQIHKEISECLYRGASNQPEKSKELASFVYLAAKEEPKLFELVTLEYNNDHIELSPLPRSLRTNDVLKRWSK